MAEKKEAGTPITLSDRVKVYAPKGAKYHKEGEETSIHPNQQEKFEALGYTTEPGEAKAAKKKAGAKDQTPPAE